MGRKRTRRALREAAATGEPVLVRRNLWKADHLEGFVVDVDDAWATLHLVHDVGLNGWSTVRLDTVRDVVHLGADAFITRALDLVGDEPLPLGLDLESAADVIRSSASAFPLVTLYTEAADPGVCAIGRPRRLGATKVSFLDISSEGEWEEDPRHLRLADITRVDVGGRFETVLHHLGGYPPIPD